MTRDDWTAVEVINAGGRAPVVLVCEHAARDIPAELDDLGLSEASLRSHVAWDVGARDLAVALAAEIDAPLVAGSLSRLVYDCNRPPEAPDAVPARSEVTDIPGNRELDAAARAARVTRVHDAFHGCLDSTIEAHRAAFGAIALVTLHSFTPVFHGAPRAVQIGFLHESDPALAQAALWAEKARGVYAAALNEPYSSRDGVTYSLRRHGDARGLPSLMIELRNDLLSSPAAARVMAAHLKVTLTRALAALPTPAGAA